MLALLVLHACAALLAPPLVAWLGRRAFYPLALPSIATLGWALWMTPRATGSGDVPYEVVDWVPQLGMALSFRLDTLSWLLCLIVGGVGALVLVYCVGYFDDDEPGLSRFAASLTAFAGVMFGLVATDNLLLLYVFWEATTVLSYLLIGHFTESRVSRAAATQALVVTTAGGLTMLAGVIVIGQQAGTYEISELIAGGSGAGGGAMLACGVALLLIGAVSKSALVPFHFWLPGAMAAPTPVSAYLHAAAMVKAGIYLVARFAPAYAEVPTWRPIVLVLGCATMLLAAYRALRQRDLKLLLAYGTVSQLGLLTILLGLGTVDAALAGLTLLLAHALFKGALFLVVGAIDHTTGTRDIRELSGLRRSWPLLFWTSVVAAASMAGLPPVLGFVSKEGAYTALLDRPLVLAVVVLGSVFTFAYSFRFVWGAFRDQPDREPTALHHPAWQLAGIPAVLAALTLAAGPLSKLLEPSLASYADTLAATGKASATHPVHLGLWHGFGPALLLTVVTVGLGSLLVWKRRGVETLQSALPHPPEAESGYRATMHALDRAALSVTGVFARGSLPQELGIILLVFAVLAGVTLPGALSSTEVRWWSHPAQPLVAVVVIAAAVIAARSRRRLRAIFLVGLTGYGTAVLFLLHGAPDLALTQVLVETVSLVVFVLVVRRLPGRFNDNTPRRFRIVRWVLGAAVGVVTAGAALAAGAARQVSPSGDGLLESAYSFGGGKNVVNVILVDARAWDTMGELSVVLVAATGVASLVFIRDDPQSLLRTANSQLWRRRHRANRQERQESRQWLLGGRFLDDRRRSTLLEIVTRVIFHTVVMWSLYLLFSGHNLPGGGFAAGLVCGLALVVRYLSGARAELRAAAPVMPAALLGIGLFLATGSAVLPMFVGGEPLQTAIWDIAVPLLGNVHVVTSVLFDVGVYLVVVGLILDIVRSLGARLDVLIEDEQDSDDAEGFGAFGRTPQPEEIS